MSTSNGNSKKIPKNHRPKTRRVNWNILVTNIDLVQEECDRRTAIEGVRVAPHRIINEMIPKLFPPR